MEDMCAILMNVNALDVFSIDIACDMGTLLENEDRLAGLLRPLCDNGTIKSGTDYKIIIFSHNRNNYTFDTFKWQIYIKYAFIRSMWILLRSVILLLVIPALAGLAVTHYIIPTDSRALKIAAALPSGYIAIWAFMELICMPVMILKLPFTAVVVITAMFAALLTALAVRLLIINDIPLPRVRLKFPDVLFVGLFAVVLGFTLYMMCTTFFYDEDDSRFVVNAVDIIKDNRILASDPITGLPLSNEYGDFRKEIVAPWAAFLALGSICTGAHVTVFAHVIYPLIALLLLVLLVACVLIVIHGEKITPPVLFSSLTLLLAVLTYGCYSRQGTERFIMSRVWQGKASIAGIGITAAILAFLLVFDICKKDIPNSRPILKGFIFLVLCNTAMCFMSSMGVVLGASLIAAYGLVLAVYKKRFSLLVYAGLCCIPNVVLYLISHFYTFAMYMGV